VLKDRLYRIGLSLPRQHGDDGLTTDPWVWMLRVSLAASSAAGLQLGTGLSSTGMIRHIHRRNWDPLFRIGLGIAAARGGLADGGALDCASSVRFTALPALIVPPWPGCRAGLQPATQRGASVTSHPVGSTWPVHGRLFLRRFRLRDRRHLLVAIVDKCRLQGRG
jgi:hypothetical protein